MHGIGQIRGFRQMESGCIDTAQALGDAGAVLTHGDDGFRRMYGHILGERVPVQTAVVTTDQNRHRLRREASQRRDAGERRGADGIVDIADAVFLTQALQPVRQGPEVFCRRRKCRRIQTKGIDGCQGRADIAGVVLARHRQFAQIQNCSIATVQRVALGVPAVIGVEPVHLGFQTVRQRRNPRRFIVEHHMAGLRFCNQRRFILEIGLKTAMPVEMFRVEIQHHRHFRPNRFESLVARHLDDPEFRLLGPVHGFQQRRADVADQGRAFAGAAQQMRDQRADRALAFGGGHAHGARIGMGGEPEGGAADEARAFGLRRQGFRPVFADAR